MRIVVLVKPVPDPASAGERLGPDGRLDRAAVPAVVNGNDEYVLEAALKLVEAAGEGEITLLSMAPTNAPETLRKALAMGATRAVHVTDPALAGSDQSRPRRCWPRRWARSNTTWSSPASTRRMVSAASCPSAVAAHLGLPYLSYAAKIEPDMANRTVRVRRISATGYDVLEAPLPGDHRRDPGARRAALPVAEGDHGGAQQGDRHEVARRTSGWMRRGSGEPARPPPSSTAGSHRPGPRRRSCAEPRPRRPSAIVDFLAERRLI